MLLETVFGVAAGIIASVRLFPQVYKTVKVKKADDLSFWFLIMVSSQAPLLIGYGLVKPDWYIVCMNIIPLICSFILLELKYLYRAPANNAHYTAQSKCVFSPATETPNQESSCEKSFFYSPNQFEVVMRVSGPE